MLHFLSDRAIWLGHQCASRAERLQVLRDRWIARGKYWNAVAKWLRTGFARPLSEILAEKTDNV